MCTLHLVNGIELTRAYVDSLGVTRTRIVVIWRESNGARAFESRPLR